LLSDEVVERCLFDFLERLQALENVPTLWCPLTQSGAVLCEHLKKIAIKHFQDLADQVSVLRIEYGGIPKKICFDSLTPKEELSGQRILLLDSAIHSGKSMSLATDELFANGATEVLSYSLIVKQGSDFLPSIWGIMLGDTDRAFFLLDKIPSQRLYTSQHIETSVRKRPFYVHIRKLEKNRPKEPRVECGVESMDKISWADRYFDMATSSSKRTTYILLQQTEIVGYLTIHFERGELFIDELAVDKKHQGKKYSGVLLRFAENMCRHADCRKIKLHAIKEKIDYYRHFGYEIVLGAPILELNDEEYHSMERRVLNYFSPHSIRDFASVL